MASHREFQVKRNIIQEGVWFENTSGIFVADTSSPKIINNIIFGYYQGIRISGGTPTILFNTLDQNKYGIFGADNGIIANTIVTNGSYGIFAVPSPRITLLHNNVWNNGIAGLNLNYQNCTPGKGDISENPLYQVNPLFSLHKSSPCIDKGVDVGIDEDFLGHKRPADSGYDMGAFEYESTNHIAERVKTTPHSFSLSQNYPNPFNSETTIHYSIDKGMHVRLVIYDFFGKWVKELVDSKQESGVHIIRWDGTNENNAPVASGIYLCRMQTGYFEKIKKLILLR